MQFIVAALGAWLLVGHAPPGDGAVPQASDAQLVRLAVADVLRTAEFAKPLYDHDRIVLDTARVGMMLAETGLVRPDPRAPLPHSTAEMRELADRAGATIAGPNDVVRCEGVRCRPFDVLTVKLGDPRIVGDNAYALYRIYWVNGGPTISANICSQLVVTLHRDSTGWHPTRRMTTRGNVPTREYPIVAIGRTRPGPQGDAAITAAKNGADSLGLPAPVSRPDSLQRCDGDTR